MLKHIALPTILCVLTAAAQAHAAIVITFDDQPLGSPPIDFFQSGFFVDFRQVNGAMMSDQGNPGHAAAVAGNGGFLRFEITRTDANPFTIDGFDEIHLTSGVDLDTFLVTGVGVNGASISNSYQNNTSNWQRYIPFDASMQFVSLSFSLVSSDPTSVQRIDNIELTIIPTPGAAALLGMGGLLAARRRR